MNNDFVRNQGQPRTSFFETLKAMLQRAAKLDMAVSYVQMSGWVVIDDLTNGLAAQNIRLLVTDQLGLTQPEALRRAVERGIQVRNFKGDRVFHPKVYLAYDAKGRPLSAVVGSANVSESGLINGVEAGMVTTQLGVLKDVASWFNSLFSNYQLTEAVDDAFLRRFTDTWVETATKRVRARAVAARHFRLAAATAPSPEALDILEDLFSTAKLPVGTLGIDHAANNIRNLTRLLQVLRRHPRISDKERSELKLLGFLQNGILTSLGVSARNCTTERRLAEVWCRWVQQQDEGELDRVNPRLASFRRTAERFWTLRSEVRRFFFDRLASDPFRPTLQTIELLCSVSELVRKLSVEDFQSLAPVVLRAEGLPSFFQKPIQDYQNNKGSRSWHREDRKTMMLAWRAMVKHSPR